MKSLNFKKCCRGVKFMRICRKRKPELEFENPIDITEKGFIYFFKFPQKSSKYYLQGCSANSDGANSDDRANSDDFLGKSLELIFVIIPTFPQILTA